MKKSPNPNKERERKTKRSRLGFFNSNPEHSLPLQREFKRFDFYGYRVVNVTFLGVLGDFVDLVCFRSRGSRSCRLNAHHKKSDLIYQRGVVSLIGLMFTRKEITAFVISMHTAGRVANLVHLVHHNHSYLSS